MKGLKIKLYIISMICILIILFVIFYPLSFDYYELSKAKKIVDIIGVIIFIFSILSFNGYNLIKGNGSFKEYIFTNIVLTLFYCLFYFGMFRPFFSSCLISINSIYSDEKKVLIDGIVKDKIYIEGFSKSPGKYILTVKTTEDIYTLESKGYIIDSISIGDNFRYEMKKGVLGILYK